MTFPLATRGVARVAKHIGTTAVNRKHVLREVGDEAEAKQRGRRADLDGRGHRVPGSTMRERTTIGAASLLLGGPPVILPLYGCTCTLSEPVDLSAAVR